jgi:hypothetical protein
MIGSWITKAQLAAAKQVAVRTVDNWMRGRIVPYLKIGRVVRFDARKTEQALQAFEHRSIADIENQGGAE